MGVAGCGKSSLGACVADALGWELIEGDDFHVESSKAKMRMGVPLADADRAAWLDMLGLELALHRQAVLTCSALKRSYRDQLRSHLPDLRFAFLQLDEAAARDRVAARFGEHLFPPTLVASQFAALEPPRGEAGVLWLDATLPLGALKAEVLQWITAPGPNTEVSEPQP